MYILLLICLWIILFISTLKWLKQRELTKTEKALPPLNKPLPNVVCATKKISEKEIISSLQYQEGMNLTTAPDSLNNLAKGANDKLFKILRIIRDTDNGANILRIIYYILTNKLWDKSEIRQKIQQYVSSSCDMDDEIRDYYLKYLPPTSNRTLQLEEIGLFLQMLKVNAFVIIPLQDTDDYKTMALNYSMRNKFNVFLLSNEFTDNFNLLVHYSSRPDQICCLFEDTVVKSVVNGLDDPNVTEVIQGINGCANVSRVAAEKKESNTNPIWADSSVDSSGRLTG
jgi:hypothetical protein